MSQRRRSAMPWAMTLGLLAFTACSQPAPRSAPLDEDANRVIPVGARAAQVGSLRATIHVSGSVVPADGAEFLAIAPEPARIIEITRNEGDPVSAGDVLVRFELATSTQELARQQADMARLQAQLENVRATRQRTLDFVERGLVPRNDLGQADRDLAEAETAVAAAERTLERAEDSAARAILRAPFAGVVASRLQNPGDLALASPSTPVLRVVDPTRLEVLALVPGADASRVLPGASARVAGFVDGQAIPLTVASQPSGMPDSEGRLRVRLTFAAPAALTVDSPVEVDIDGEERQNVVFVPPSALVATGADAAVFVAVGDLAERRAVTTGVTTTTGVEIVSGLEAGELVITRGQGAVTDGARISAAIEP